MGFPCGSEGKESDSNVGDPGLIPGWGRPPGEGNGNPLQYSYLGNSMDRGAWWATVHGVTNSQTRLSTFIFIWSLKDLEKSGSRETCLISTQPFPEDI